MRSGSILNKVLVLAAVLAVLSGCSTAVMKELTGDIGNKSEPEGQYFENPPLSEKWNNVEVLNYSYGHFTFPPPAGYRVLQYINHVDNVSLDLYREELNNGDGFLDLIRRHRGSDHCELYGEKITQLPYMEMIEVNGDCYIWHRGDFKRKYYFLRVGNLVFTFRMFSSPKDFERNTAEFDRFVNYTVSNFLVETANTNGSTAAITPDNIAYPIPRDDLLAFFKPAVKYLESQR